MYTIDFSSIEFVDDVGSSFASLLEAQMEYGFISQIQYEQLPPNMKMLVDKYNEDHKKSSNKSNANKDSIKKYTVTHQFGDNITSAINFSIEQYDKASDELVLQSECLVEAYNNMITGKATDAVILLLDRIKASDKSQIDDKINILKESNAGFRRLYNMCLELSNTMNTLTDKYKYKMDITYRDIRDAVIDAEFYPSDNDPEKVKRIINARIQYNNTIMEMFKLMIYNNYELLGLSKDVALVYSAKLSSPDHSVQKEAVKDIKRIIKEQSDKFKINGHRTWDFRKLGLGVLFRTEESMGKFIESVDTPDHFIQILSQYDCVVDAHGGNKEEDNSEKLRDQLEQALEKNRKALVDKLDKLKSQYENLTKYINSEYDKLDAKFKMLNDEYSDSEKFKAYVEKIYKFENKEIEERLENIEKLKKMIRSEKIALEFAYDNDDSEAIKYRIGLYEKQIKLYEAGLDYCEKDARESYNSFMKIINGLDEYDIATEFKNKIKPILDKSEKRRNLYKIKIDHYNDKQKYYYDEIQKSKKALNRHIDKNKYWSIQPVYTLTAGPFTRVDDLVRQLIKEGFKKILLCNCNPGGHKLPKDITQKEGITIRMSKTNTLVESACETVDPYEQIHLDIENSQLNMAQMCESFNINYWDDISLNEITNDYNNTLESMNEGTLKNIWTKIKELIKKAVTIVVNLVKRLFDIIKTFIDKIKAWFKRLHESKKYDDKFKKSVKTSIIIVENASVDKFSANNWDDLENKTIKACSAIQKKIDELQNKQLKNYKELDKYADQMSKTTNESSISELDSLVNMLW